MNTATMESQHIAKVSKYRWVILLLYCLYSAINFLQFIQYSIINNITKKYYEVSSTMVDLNSLIFMFTFIALCLPCNRLIKKYNLKAAAFLSCSLTSLGNLIKLLSVAQNRFYVVLLGQLCCAIAQVFVLSVPAKLASTWFGPGEVSTACAIAILGNQVGLAVGSVWIPNFVRNSDDPEDIGHDLMALNIANAATTCAISVLVFIFFRAKPAVPPSQSQVKVMEAEQVSVLRMLGAIVQNRDYVLLVAAIGGSNGMYTCFGVLINKAYLHYFPGAESDLGIITAIAIVAGGCIGSLVFGLILDKWHKFKLTSFLIIASSALAYIFVVLTLEFNQKLATYFTIPVFVFFLASTLLIGFEYATEIMYPIPEEFSCSVLNALIYVFTIVFTLVFEQLFTAIGYIPTHVLIFLCLVLCSIAVCFISPKLNRREANVNFK